MRAVQTQFQLVARTRYALPISRSPAPSHHARRVKTSISHPTFLDDGVMERFRRMGGAKLNARRAEELRLAGRIHATIMRLADSVSEGLAGRFVLVRKGQSNYRVGFEPTPAVGMGGGV